MNILVTGGAGFLGSHVADALSEAGHRVTVLDLQDSPYLRQDQKMVRGDILDEKLIAAVIREQDVVYHFAGIADIDECARQPVETVTANILGTVMVLEACRQASIKRFVFASSAYVYSDAGYFYRTSKQACESYIENYSELFGMPYTCLRYGSLYGERAGEKSSLYRIIRQAIQEGKITYYGSGDEIRELLHVRDAAQCSVRILAAEFANQHIIIAGTQSMRYRDILAMINEMLANKIAIEILPSTRKAHFKITPYNFSPKLGKKLVANPHIDLGQGLLLCMANIYEAIHHEKHEEQGLMVDKAP
jgi:UDP-glucose 4-epimerase